MQFQDSLRQCLAQSMEALGDLSETMQLYVQAQANSSVAQAESLPDLDALLHQYSQQCVTHAQLRGHLEETGRSTEVRGSGAAIELF